MNFRHWIWNKFATLIKPRMVWGYKNSKGKMLDNVRISSSTYIDHRQNLTIEDNVYIGHHNFIEASNNITIEKGTQITNFVNITTHSSHVAIRLYGNKYIESTDHTGYTKGEVYIGKYTFIGPHVVIMPDTKIGKGSIVSAYSYVKGNFPDFSVLKGNPAVVIGDTRDIDRKFLEEFPSLKETYNQWASEK